MKPEPRLSPDAQAAKTPHMHLAGVMSEIAARFPLSGRQAFATDFLVFSNEKVMATQKKLYEGIPAGAVFEASQKSLRRLDLKVVKEDPRSLSITAKSGMTMKSFGQDLVLTMVEIGQATELTIKTSSGQAVDWGEGKSILNNLLSCIDSEIAKIREEGRIAPVAAPVYGMGQAPQLAPAANVAGASQKESKSGGSWVFRIIGILGFLWLINTEAGSELLSSLIGSFGVETDIAQYDCDKVADLFKGENLQNAFGGNFKIIQVRSPQEVSKTATKIVCTGQMDLSNGTAQNMRMTVEKGSSAAEILYRAEPI